MLSLPKKASSMEKTGETLNNSEREQAKDFASLFRELRIDVISYVNKRLSLYRLDLLERISKSSSLVVFGLIVAFTVLAAFSFALIALALCVGELLGSTAAGFGVVSLFWIFLTIVALLCREPIKKYFFHRTVRILYKIEKEADDE